MKKIEFIDRNKIWKTLFAYMNMYVYAYMYVCLIPTETETIYIDVLRFLFVYKNMSL